MNASIFYRVLATLIPTGNVTALVGFLTTFTQKLAAAEAAQLTIAMDYAREIDVLTAKRDEAVAVARKAGNLSLKLADLVS